MIKRDENGLRVDVDMVLLYLCVLIAIVAIGIKLIRWAATS